MVQAQPVQTVQENLFPKKQPEQKWTGGVAQVVGHLLYKWEALSANHNPTK
jgi:hypothetical protein